MIGDPLHEVCGEAAMVDLVGVDDLPLPPELAPGGDADPDREWAWRDHEATDAEPVEPDYGYPADEYDLRPEPDGPDF